MYASANVHQNIYYYNQCHTLSAVTSITKIYTKTVSFKCKQKLSHCIWKRHIYKTSLSHLFASLPFFLLRCALISKRRVNYLQRVVILRGKTWPRVLLLKGDFKYFAWEQVGICNVTIGCRENRTMGLEGYATKLQHPMWLTNEEAIIIFKWVFSGYSNTFVFDCIRLQIF